MCCAGTIQILFAKYDVVYTSGSVYKHVQKSRSETFHYHLVCCYICRIYENHKWSNAKTTKMQTLGRWEKKVYNKLSENEARIRHYKLLYGSLYVLLVKEDHFISVKHFFTLVSAVSWWKMLDTTVD